MNILKNSYRVQLQNNYKANINMGNLVSELHKLCRPAVAARSLGVFRRNYIIHVTITFVNVPIIIPLQSIHYLHN